MPELPEVETLRRQLAQTIKGKIIKSIKCDWAKMVKPLSIAEFQKKIKNKKIIDVGRRAKVLILDLSGKLSLLIHLKLTGQLIFQPKTIGHKPLANRFTHLIFNFTDGSKLFFNDLRKFGWARLVDDRGASQVVEATGPEPLSKEFSLDYLKTILKKYPNRKIKQVLLDQRLIGGIGNIYADESCFCAGILPTRPAQKIKPAEIGRLFNCINKIIKFAISKRGTSADTYVQLNGRPGQMEKYLKVYGRKGEKCRRCNGVIYKIKMNGRGTHFCSKCQK